MGKEKNYKVSKHLNRIDYFKNTEKILNYNYKKGTTIAITGYSNAGKSTSIKMLQHMLYKKYNGNLNIIENKNLRKQSAMHWASKINIVPNYPTYLFIDEPEVNIDGTNYNIRDKLHYKKCEEFIEKMNKISNKTMSIVIIITHNPLIRQLANENINI